MSKYSLFFLFIFISSCGLRLTNEVDENLLIGKWDMEFIKCYENNTSEEVKEEYRLVGQATGELEFVDNRVNYFVRGDTCSTSSSGEYGVSFTAKNTGSVDFQNLVIGGSCIEKLDDVKSTQPADVNLHADAIDARSLVWKVVDSNYLIIDFFTNFKGSKLLNFCAQNCHCRLELKKL